MRHSTVAAEVELQILRHPIGAPFRARSLCIYGCKTSVRRVLDRLIVLNLVVDLGGGSYVRPVREPAQARCDPLPNYSRYEKYG